MTEGLRLSNEYLKREALRMAIRQCMGQDKTPDEITTCAKSFYLFLKIEDKEEKSERL